MPDLRSADRAAARQRPEPLPHETPHPVAASESPSTCEVTLTFEDNRAASVVLGQYDQNLAKLERVLGVVGHANGNHVTLKGENGACEQARRVLELLYARAASGHEITLGDVDRWNEREVSGDTPENGVAQRPAKPVHLVGLWARDQESHPEARPRHSSRYPWRVPHFAETPSRCEDSPGASLLGSHRFMRWLNAASTSE